MLLLGSWVRVCYSILLSYKYLGPKKSQLGAICVDDKNTVLTSEMNLHAVTDQFQMVSMAATAFSVPSRNTH